MRTFTTPLVTRSLAITVALAATLSLSGCFGSPVNQIVGSDQGVTQNQKADEPVEPSAQEDETCNATELAAASPAPAVFAELRVPFYPCGQEMTAVSGTDPIFVGEYVTGHELDTVTKVINDQFEESDWEVVGTTVEGTNTVSTAQKPGYSLVVVIGLTYMSETDISIIYTLRPS